MQIESFLLIFAIVLAVGRLGAEAAERLSQPAVLGELFAGMLIGVSGLRLLNPAEPLFYGLSEIGVLLLLFEVGLECDAKSLFSCGFSALWVACVGVILPMAFGYEVSIALGMNFITALFMGAALTATSVGLTARVFGDLKRLKTREASIVLGAAVADDIIGLIVLAVVGGMASSAGVSLLGIGKLVLIALIFLIGGSLLGLKIAPYMMKIASDMNSRGAIGVTAIVFCFLLSVMAARSGLAPIVGAFTAGLILSRTDQSLHIEKAIKPVADIFIPIFFICMGAATDLSKVSPINPSGRSVLYLTMLLLFVAIAGKVLAGLSVPGKGLKRWIIGVGMIPRGEVGLIFANLGLSHRILNAGEYATIVAVVLGSTLITPPMLRQLIKSEPENEDALDDILPYEDDTIALEAKR